MGRGPGSRANRRRHPSGRQIALRRLLGLAAIAALAVLVAILAHRGRGGESQPQQRSLASATSHTGSPPRAKVISPRLPHPLSGEALAAQGRRLLVIGGLDSAGLSRADVYAIDPAGDRIQPAGTLAEPLHDLAAVSLAGKTIAAGGGSAATTDAVQLLSPGGKARVEGHLPRPASDLSALSLAGRAYVVGGYDGQTTVGSVLQIGATGSLRRIAELQTPVRYTALAALRGSIYAFGGELADGSDTDLIQEVDPGTGRARVRGRLPHSLAHAGAITLAGRIYLLGGRESGVSSARMRSFDPTSGRTKPVGMLPYPVTNAAAAVAGGTGYLVGGLGADGRTLSTLIRIR